MKFGLQRIEAMLGQLNTQDTPQARMANVSLKSASLNASKSDASTVHPSTAHTSTPPESSPSPQALAPQALAPQAAPLALPKNKAVSVSSHRHATNPDLAITLLKDVESKVVGWQLELEQVILQIQAIYVEGPIVEGWLESQANDNNLVASAASMATLRHGDVDRLMEYVEAICQPNSASGSASGSSPVTPPSLDESRSHVQAHVQTDAQADSRADSRTDYRLCGLDADGQVWCRPCPAQQVPYVSLAIARYQKLRILLSKKQTLENRLNQLIQSLTLLSGQIQKG
jgi:hypothetical protein